MNILYTAYSGLGKGGAEVSMYTLAKNIPNVSIASTQEYPGVKTFIIPRRKHIDIENQNVVFQKVFQKIIKNNNINLIHSHDSITAIAAIRAAENCRIPVITHYRDYWFCCPISSLLRPNLNPCDKCSYTNLLTCQRLRYPWNAYKLAYLKSISAELQAANKIAISQTIKKKLDEIGITEARIIANPVDTKEYQEKKEKPNIKEGFNALFVGSLGYHKGIHLLSKLISLRKDVTFVIIGDGPLRNLIKKDNVIHIKKLNPKGVIPYYQYCDVLLIPSLWEEPFGRTAVEGLSAGIPIIASDHGGLKEILQEEHALLLPPTKVNSWSDTITFIKNNGLIQSNKKLVNPYDIAYIKKELNDYYDEVLKNYGEKSTIGFTGN
ncbi:MAG: glycosyltransferase family 4 protein [Nanoarchaeota archaeon]